MMRTPEGFPPGSPLPPIAGSAGGGFSWAGDLREVKVNALYAACHSLRFTGRLELKDANHAAQIVFLGGDPVEISGGDTKVISLWSEGQFLAVQCLPNLTGELTDQTEQVGSLAVVKASRLLAWVSEYRLSCQVRIERPGEVAVLLFRNGQLESADVNGHPELAALARVQAWVDGSYRVALRPLFTEGGVISLAPPTEGVAPAGRAFDVSKSIPLDLKAKAKLETSVGTVSFGENGDVRLEAGGATVAQPMPRLRATNSSSNVDAAQRMAQVFSQTATPRPARWPWVMLILLSLAGTGAAVAYTLHLPPFPPPPRPIPPVPPVTTEEPPKAAPIAKPTEPSTATPTAAPTPPEAEAKPEAKPEPEAKAEAKPEAKPEPEAKPVDPAALEPKGTGTPGAEVTETVPLDQRLIEKGRLLLVDGHPHSALSLFRKAEQTNPDNALAKTLQQMAMGKLGKAELVVDGKGEIIVDGKRVAGGKKLKLFAGPHAVDTGSGPEELVLKKGERRHLKAR